MLVLGEVLNNSIDKRPLQSSYGVKQWSKVTRKESGLVANQTTRVLHNDTYITFYLIHTRTIQQAQHISQLERSIKWARHYLE